MATLTLNISDPEMAVIDRLAAEHDMSKTAVLRQAIRFYQLMHDRLKAGETFHFSGDQQRAMEFIGVGLGQDLSPNAEGK
jgi:predicted transcriptional regulator